MQQQNAGFLFSQSNLKAMPIFKSFENITLSLSGYANLPP
jgi:hypothetical protein